MMNKCLTVSSALFFFLFTILSSFSQNLDYTTTWMGSSLQPNPPYPTEDHADLLIPNGGVFALKVTPDGRVYTTGSCEWGGAAAYRYNETSGKVEIIGRYAKGSVGAPKSYACAIDDNYFYTTHKTHGFIRTDLMPAPGEVYVDKNAVIETPVSYRLVPGKDFSVRWTGKVVIPAKGHYRFAIHHSDKIRMWVDGEKVIDYWKSEYRALHTSDHVYYNAGQAIDIVIEQSISGMPRLIFEWQRPDGIMAPVPSSVLRTPDGKQGLHAEYFSDEEFSTPAFQRVDPYVYIKDNDYPKRASYLGMDIHEGELYVSDASYARICVFDLSSLTMTRSFSVDFLPGKLEVDNSENGPFLWVVDEAGGKVRSFTLEGEPGPEEISGIPKPTALAIDDQNRIWVGDAGHDMQILVYDDITTDPHQVRTFGQKGGVWSGEKGDMGPRRFRNFKSIDIGDDGRVYIACDYTIPGGGRTSIQCYNYDGSRLWHVYNNTYCSNAVIDPDDESVVYTTRQTYRVDWSMPVGPVAEHVTWESLSFQNRPADQWADSRYQSFFMPVTLLKYEGEKFIFMTHQKGRSDFWIYRLEGNQWVPGGYFAGNISGSFQVTPGGNSLPPANPLGYASYGVLIWQDANGNGTWKDDMDEFSVSDRGYAKSVATIGEDGSIWWVAGIQAKDDPKLYRLQPDGLTSQDFPDYHFPYEDFTNVMPEYYDIHAIEYDSEESVMYFMAREEEGDLRMYRYDQFPGDPVLSWKSETIPWEDPDFTPELGYGAGVPKIHKHAGDYLFIPYGYGGWVRVYNARNGEFVQTMKPNTIPYGGQGEVDAMHALTAFQRSNGEYIVCVESAGMSRVTIYRWCPTGNCAE